MPESETFRARTISREVSSRKPLRDYTPGSQGDNMSKAYLLGALHDGTSRKYTYRISQKYLEYVKALAEMIRNLGGNAWVYREGKKRNLYVVEFARSFLRGATIMTVQDKLDYIAGYFDAEGSVPKIFETKFRSASEHSVLKQGRMYVYFAQKDKRDLTEVKTYLTELGVRCGKTHNPSKAKDPNYWRFFVLYADIKKFAQTIVSRHPRKRFVLQEIAS